MGQISPHLRRAEHGYGHWCPGCGEMHIIPDSWTFDGNIDAPSFNPSVKISSGATAVVDAEGRWTGEWIRDAAGLPVPYCCHYFLHAGVLKFCSDCTHSLASKDVPLPPLPDFMRDL